MEFETLLLNALQTRFAGVDAKILGRMARKAAKGATGTTEADAKAIADAMTIQQILDSHADFRVTEAQKSAVANYEAKHNLRDGKPVGSTETGTGTATGDSPKTGRTQDDGADDNMPAWARKLADDNKALREQLSAFESERTRTTRLERFRKTIEKAPAKIRERYEKDFGRLVFKDDADFDSYLTEIEPDISAIAAQASAKGATVGAPMGNKGTASGPSALVKARYEAAAKAEAAPAIAGLPNTNR